MNHLSAEQFIHFLTGKLSEEEINALNFSASQKRLLQNLYSSGQIEIWPDGAALMPARALTEQYLSILAALPFYFFRVKNDTLNALPDALWENPHLLYIELVDLTLPGTFALPALPPALLGLNILGCPIQSFTTTLPADGKLERLELSNNKLQNITIDVKQEQSLPEINLRSNALEDVPEFIYHVKGIKELDLSHNQLDTIEDPLCEQLQDAVALYLSDNKISSLPASVKKMQQLQILFLQNNLLHDLQPLVDLRRIEELFLSGNKAETIPDKFCAFAHLRELYLSANNIQHVPDCLLQHPTLKLLTLKENHPLLQLHMGKEKSPQLIVHTDWEE